MHYTIPKPEHGSQEWLTARWRDDDGNPIITASQASCVHGVNEYRSTADYAIELMMDTPPEPGETSTAMERGNKMEPFLLRWAEETYPGIVTPDIMYGYKDERVSLMATLDGWVHPGIVVEVKTTRKYFDGTLPPNWYWQGVQQAICADTNKVIWVIFDGRLELHFHEQIVTSDEKQIHLDVCAEFLNDVRNGVVPDPSTATMALMSKRFPESQSVKVELDSIAVAALEQLEEARKRKKIAEEMEESAKVVIAAALGDADTGQVDGETRVTWRSQSRESFDAKAFEADHPALAAKYRKVTSFRTMRMK